MTISAKRVELIELFYDLIYVYAISRLTALLEEPSGGIIPAMDAFQYLVTSFVILQAWLYLTNYVNRFGQWRWYEYAIVFLNLTATVYMTNTISHDWSHMALPFSIAMLIMLLCVALLYLIQWIRGDASQGAARNSLSILLIVCTIYLIAILCSRFGKTGATLFLDVVAVFTGAFLPFFRKGNFQVEIINFPHLVERFELLTIITFGEAVVGMTGYFRIHDFSPAPVLVFGVILSLFGSYVVQIHQMLEHHQVTRALPLMFSHYFIVISINLITVGLHLLQNNETDPLFLCALLILSLLVYFVSLMANHIYYKPGYRFSKTDGLVMGSLLLAGSVIMLLGRARLYGILGGTLLITAGNAAYLLQKYRTPRKDS